MFNVVLVAPEIPANTGNIGRTCVVSGCSLHLVGPLGFDLSERALKRAGLGYWRSLDVHVYQDWAEFAEVHSLETNDERLHLLSKKAVRTYAEAQYRPGDFLVFGSESVGLDEVLLGTHAKRCERIPMLKDSKSLVDSENWEAPTTGQDGRALLKPDIAGNFVNPDGWRISALNLSNAAAIVVYEGLRQLGFPEMLIDGAIWIACGRAVARP